LSLLDLLVRHAANGLLMCLLAAAIVLGLHVAHIRPSLTVSALGRFRARSAGNASRVGPDGSGLSPENAVATVYALVGMVVCAVLLVPVTLRFLSGLYDFATPVLEFSNYVLIWMYVRMHGL